MSKRPTSRIAQLKARLGASLEANRVVSKILEGAPRLALPDWYLGAGCVAQTVWNELHGFPPTVNISDYDLVYFDRSDLSEDSEDFRAAQARELLQDLGGEIDLKNEARVHLWYPDHFGYAIEPYTSTEDAISTWPTTATAVGVRKEADGQLTVFAPFGLDDLFGLVVRPNKRQITEEIYLRKVERWTKCWPKLVVIPWDRERGELTARTS